MADDPTDPTNTDAVAAHTAAVEDDTVALQRNTDVARANADVTTNVKNQLSSLTNIIDNVGGLLDNLTDSYLDAQKNMQTGLFSAEDARNIGLVTTALLGVRNSYDQFSGLRIDKEAFMAPITDMEDALKNGGGALNKMADQVLSTFGSIIPDSAKKSASAAVTFGMNLIKSADNAIHMRDAIIQLASSSGSLNNLFAASGPNLQNINEIMAQQSEEISNVAQTMNVSRAEATKYYSELGRVPGALTATLPASEKLFKGMDDSMGNSSGKVDMLTATIAAAKGTGREFGDVIRDLNTAFKDYGITGENALKFSVNMSQVSNNLGIDLQSVQSSLSASAQTFREFADAGNRSANMAEGLARVTNEYAQALKNQGFSGTVALEVAQNMTKQLSQLSIGQRAFLSAQSGGPGGLLGAVQIERDLREGKFESVFKKVKDVMQKQIGPIITQGEVKTEAQAAQYTRQITMLQQGPLAKLAGNEEQAARLLEVFKGGGARVKAFEPDALKGAMDKGVTLQDQTRTILSEIRGDSERQLALADQTNLLLAQQLALASGSQRGAESKGEKIYRDSLRRASRNAAERAEQVTERTGMAIGTAGRAGAGVDLGVNTAREGLVQNTGNMADMLSIHKGSIVKTIIDKAREEIDLIKKKISNETNPEARALLEKQAAQKMREADAITQGSLLGIRNEQTPITSGGALGTTVATSLNAPTATPERATETGTAVAGRAVAPSVDHSGHINVHVTGYCIRCKQEIEGGSQMASVSTQAKNTSPS